MSFVAKYNVFFAYVLFMIDIYNFIVRRIRNNLKKIKTYDFSLHRNKNLSSFIDAGLQKRI